MPISRNNFTALPVEAEQEGVDVSFFTVDFINAMNSETGDPQADSTAAGLALVQAAIMNLGINILATGPLGNSHTTCFSFSAVRNSLLRASGFVGS